jgi:hypothetical protein
LCATYARPVFFEKSPQIVAHTAALDLLFEWYQNTGFRVKFVFLVRNPMSIMYSAYQLFYTDPETRQYGWFNLMSNMLEFYRKIKDTDRIWLRYEDLVDNPISTFKTVQNFIGIPVVSNVGSEAHRESKKKWINDDNYGFQFNEDIKEFIYEIGYSDEDIFNPLGKKPKLSHKLWISLSRCVKLPAHRFKNAILLPMLLGRVKRK